MSGSVFISYRRDDARRQAKEIYSHLVGDYGRPKLFIDIETINPGADFREIIRSYVARSAVMIVIIGPMWVRRLAEKLDSEDWVRSEIESALKANIRIIPVLINDATMPSATELPDTLKALAFKNALRITDGKQEDLTNLSKSLSPDVSGLVIDRISYVVAGGVAMVAMPLALVVGILVSALLFITLEAYAPSLSFLKGRSGLAREYDLLIPGPIAWLQITLPFFGLLVFGIFAAGWWLERRYRNIVRFVVVVTIYGTVIGAAYINIVHDDTLINLNVQFVLDLVVLLISAYLLIMFWTLPAETVALKLGKGAVIFTTIVLGIIVPSLFVVMFGAFKLGITQTFHVEAAPILQWGASIMILIGALTIAWNKRS
jgi:hypothetical protein